MIPGNIDGIKNMTTQKAKFILIIEKDATFQSLLDAQITSRFPCILLTVTNLLSI